MAKDALLNNNYVSLNNSYTFKFLEFLKSKERIILSNNETQQLLESLAPALVYANKNLLEFITQETYEFLLFNLWLHYIIVDGVFTELSDKYDISANGNGLIVTSVSSAGTSTSAQSIKTLDNGDFVTLDLFRTPYGRKAYSILESISNSAIVLL